MNKKSKNKDKASGYRYFLGSNILGVNRLFVLVYIRENADTQLNKLKSATKNKTGTILWLNRKSFKDKEWRHESFLITR